MRRFSWTSSVAGLLVLVLVACGQAAPGATPASTADAGAGAGSGTSAPAASAGAVSSGAPVTDQTSFVEQVRALGYTVEETGPIEQPFLQSPGTAVRLSGSGLQQPADIQVFSYADAASAENDAGQIGPDGNPRTTMISWVAPPHFFRSGPVLALYVGNDASVVDALTQVLGPQFAGR